MMADKGKGRSAMFWKCPQCHGDLAAAPDSLACAACDRRYPVVAELPDFRLGRPAWIDFDRDRDRALAVDALIRAEGLEAGIANVFEISRRFDPAKIRFRTRQVLAGADKYDRQIEGWLAATRDRPLLEVGVGPGQMSVALARRGIAVHGIDVSMEWLVVAKHWLRQVGVEPQLATAMAEDLPVADGAVASYVSLDVIEHVGDQARYVREMARVLKPGGRYALVTPNRYSLAPEPHVGVWGVGYMPRPMQIAWVRRRTGTDYTFTRLLSTAETRRLFRNQAGLEPDLHFPPIAAEEIALFPPFKARLARIYNRISAGRAFGWIAPLTGTHYQITGSRPAAASPGGSPR